MTCERCGRPISAVEGSGSFYLCGEPLCIECLPNVCPQCGIVHEPHCAPPPGPSALEAAVATRRLIGGRTAAEHLEETWWRT